MASLGDLTAGQAVQEGIAENVAEEGPSSVERLPAYGQVSVDPCSVRRLSAWKAKHGPGSWSSSAMKGVEETYRWSTSRPRGGGLLG